MRTGASVALPDCRAYEQVSPEEKGGYDATPRYTALPAQAASDGEAVAFLGSASFPEAAGNATLFDGHLSRRDEGGWQTTELTPPKTGPQPPGYYFVEYEFSEDLAQTLVDVPLQQLTPGATPGMYNLFLRDSEGAFSLVDTTPPLEPPPAGCSAEEEAFCYTEVDLNAFAGASASFEDVLFESTARYVEAAPEETPSLYESALEGGQRIVRLVGFLPDGQAASGSVAGAGSSAEADGYVQDGRVAHAISAEGSRVVFEAAADGGEPGEAGQKGMTEVYDRFDHDETVELSAPSGVPASSATADPAQFWTASSDGMRVFFTSAAALTSDANTDGGTAADLYEYDFEAPEGARLRDLSADAGEAAGARVLGVLGASEDGAYVYFAAEGALASGATEGEPNLYLVHDGQAPVLVATLSREDGRDWTATPSAEGGQLESYVDPDGHQLAFTSVARLATANFPAPGYDNDDRTTGTPDTEVYEYTAPGEDEAAGVLDCASCGAADGAPSGGALLGGVAPRGSSGTPFYQPRALSEDGGRLFFTAPDAAGGRGVDEYEQPGEGSCEAAGGCVFAISSPPAGGQDTFLDASANGNDVFFATVDRLVPGDEDQLEDVYDARVEGGFAAVTAQTCEDGCRVQGSEAASGPSIVSASTGVSGNLSPGGHAKAKGKAGKKATKKKGGTSRRKRASCRAKARHKKSGRARRRALVRCRARRAARSRHTKKDGPSGRRSARTKHAGETR